MTFKRRCEIAEFILERRAMHDFKGKSAAAKFPEEFGNSMTDRAIYLKSLYFVARYHKNDKARQEEEAEAEAEAEASPSSAAYSTIGNQSCGKYRAFKLSCAVRVNHHKCPFGAEVERELRKIILKYHNNKTAMNWRMIHTYLLILCHKYGTADKLHSTDGGSQNVRMYRKKYIISFLRRMDPEQDSFKKFAGEPKRNRASIHQSTDEIPYDAERLRQFYLPSGGVNNGSGGVVPNTATGSVEEAIEYMVVPEQLLCWLADPDNYRGV